LYSTFVRSILMLFSSLDLLSHLFCSESKFPCLVSLRSNLLLSFHLRPGFPGGLLLICHEDSTFLEFHRSPEARD
jgi:hypothetical protein